MYEGGVGLQLNVMLGITNTDLEDSNYLKDYCLPALPHSFDWFYHGLFVPAYPFNSFFSSIVVGGPHYQGTQSERDHTQSLIVYLVYCIGNSHE